jgi:tyrosine-protein phosphatase YwqE
MIGKLFSWGKNKEEESLSVGPKIDMHSHLIPGIDDGSRSVEESLSLLRVMQELGYEKVITTPHVMADAYKNSTQTILDGLKVLRTAIRKERINIRIDAAAEYYMDEELIARLERGDILTIKGEYLLFETSYVSKPMSFEDIVFEIGAKGYKPLLAHPERYRYVSDPEKEYKRMKELGIYFQLDINSLGGYYGRQAKRLAEFLAEEGMIDFLGSDVHHKKQVAYLGRVFESKSYRNLLKNNQILNETLR